MKKQLWIAALVACVLMKSVPVHAETNSIDQGISYHILIDRFNNGDVSLDETVDVTDPLAYHGGDFKGIVKRLDALKELGITTIVLSPPMANADKGFHGYWIEDFMAVEPQFGTMEDFKTLVNEAHDRDINVIMEFVMNYAAKSHPLVKESPETTVENAVIDAPWKEGAVVLDQTNQQVKEMITEAALFWVQNTDVDGFKLHAADQTNQQFLQELTDQIKNENDSFLLLASVLDEEADLTPLLENNNLDVIDDPDIQNRLRAALAEPGQSLTPVIDATDSTDKQRLLQADDFYTKRFSQLTAENGRNDLTSWKLALTYLYTAPGLPNLTQGSEIPMYGDGWPETAKLVQFNRQDEDTLAFYEKIASIREQFPVLVDGAFTFVGDSGAMSVYKRTNDNQTVYVALNNDVKSQVVSVEGLSDEQQLNGILGDNIVRQNEDGAFDLVLPRETAEVYIVEENTGLNWPFILFVGGVFLLFPIGIIVMGRKAKKNN
ncbi:Alpha-amylase [Lentibacillus sp. JNUCC-1]|uniref:alpha-amylase family glycosyl hydrolase n=1 Tax=Lentibacillus sp. JNUCC-1 TaxID=2654513 RepID=UPI001327FC15|nr:alpha-amylase family glycosyl hydrolase [Lentibacillus sp. JNUCC-1]MUV36553.1 Alpha-amylase [Lentibacillus sp. JNUCC-1]